VERAITGFHPDEDGDWVAELSCGHNQHVRHKPPFQVRPWVVEPEGRKGRVGAPLECPLCDRAELPEAAKFVRSSPEWNAETMPAGLRRAHRLAESTWARIVVDSGRLRYQARTEPPTDTVVGAASVQIVPPTVEHEVEPIGDATFHIDFLSVPR
jgi:tellurite resistance-related uncharacterized protein